MTYTNRGNSDLMLAYRRGRRRRLHGGIVVGVNALNTEHHDGAWWGMLQTEKAIIDKISSFLN